MPRKASTNQTEKQNTTPKDEAQTQQPQATQEEAQPQSAASQEQGSVPDYEAQLKELNDKMLRAVAESQNVRRRAEADIAKARDFSIEGFARDMISVLDNLYRASESISDEAAAADENLKNIKEGVEITKREMLNAFERNKIKRLFPLNEKFDPNLHQAMAQIPTDEHTPGTVVDVIQAGYTIRERLLRPALVAVAKAVE